MKISVADFKEVCDLAMFYMVNPFTEEEKEMDVHWLDEELGGELWIEKVEADVGSEAIFCYVQFDYRIWWNSDYFF